MQYQLFAPDALNAHIGLPASKSISNRALILHALSHGTHRPTNLSDCDDTQVMIRALEGEQTDIVDIKAAGTAMRFLTAYFSVTPGIRTLTGTARMQQRPIGILVDALRSLGAQITYAGNEGFPPLRITGGLLKGHEVTLASNVSSQYISALLMIGPTLPQGLTLHLTGRLISRPYIELTLQLMRDFGANADWISDNEIYVRPQAYQDTMFAVESDWSAASYWYETVALIGQRLRKTGGDAAQTSIRLSGLTARSYQGDCRGADLFARLGVRTTFTPEGVVLTPQDITTQRLDADLTDIPDLAQTFVVTCCLLGIPFRFTGLQTLRIKETDRLAALSRELLKLGYRLQDEQDSILWWDGERLSAASSPVIRTYEDHRMAMAFAPACIGIPGLCIDRPEVVTKSYPCFWDNLRSAGFQVKDVHLEI